MTLDTARKIVFDAKPRFAELFETWKDKTWKEYAKDNYPSGYAAPKHFDELACVVSDITLPLLGEDRTKAAIDTLKNTGFVSTADHSGVLCHPFFLNSTLLRNSRSQNGSAIISFTCGAVSLTNSSYPRGIFFHDKSLKEVRIPLVSLKGRRRSVYGLKAFNKKRIQEIIDSIPHFNLTDDAKQRLTSLFKGILKTEAIFACVRYSDQLVIINELIWYLLFGYKKGMLIYIEAERVIRDLLLSTHLDQDTLVHKVLFDERTRETYKSSFEGVVGAHNTREDSGAHMFWYIDESAETRVQLFLEDNRLVSKDKRVSIDLNPDSLRKHLENYTLLPSMAFCYSILAFYYGLTLGGGFSQIKYLGDIREAWRKTAHVANEEIQDTRTDIFTGEFVLAAIASDRAAAPASLIDLFLYNEGNSTFDNLEKMIETVPIGETIDAMMDEFVEIITGEKPVIEGIKIHKTLNV